MDELTKASLSVELGKFQEKFQQNHKEIVAMVEKASAEARNAGETSTHTKTQLEGLAEKSKETYDRIQALEQKMTSAPAEGRSILTIGERFTKSKQWLDMQSGSSRSAKMELKTAIVNTTGQNQPLVPADRIAGIINEPNRRLTIRDIISTVGTQSNLVEFARENVYTNNAGSQYSSPARENVTKNESGITFTLDSTPIVTLAHWVPASKQLLEDAPALMDYINTRLLYGLKLEEERQLLNGDGTNGDISGLLASGNFTAYSRAVTGDTQNDTLRRAITQCQISEYLADYVILNPIDWENIELLKSTTNEYVNSDIAGSEVPQSATAMTRWKLPVIATNSITSGTFLVGSFGMAAQIHDRKQSSISVSLENSDNFVKNMITVLAEERLALAVYRPASIVSGTF